MPDTSIKSDQLIGELHIDGKAYVLIGQHIGAKTGTAFDTNDVNGVIDGRPYGNHEEQLLLKGSELTTQTPAGLDIPLQVKFGPAQVSPGGEVSLSAAGELTANITKRFEISITMQYGRAGAGQVVWLFFVVKVDGVAAEDPILVKLPSFQSAVPVEFTGRVSLNAGEVLTVEVIRDSQGFDSGELVSETPTLGGLTQSPSARIRVSI